MARKALERGPFLWKRIDKVATRDFYCYALLDPRKPGPFAYGDYVFQYEPFYIGKGTGYRTSAHFTDAKEYQKTGISSSPDEIPKYERILDIMKSGISEKEFKKNYVIKIKEDINEFESFELEAELIRTIGRSLIKMGPLVNAIEGTQFTGGFQKQSLIGFVGMNNSGAFAPSLSSQTQTGGTVSVPRVILNADVNQRGQLVRRKGKRKLIPLKNPRCLWSCPLCMLVVADEQIGGDTAPVTSALFRVRSERAERITSIELFEGEYLYAVQIDDRVYISNDRFSKVYVPATGQLYDIGIPLPQRPLISTNEGGSLPPGLYRVCLTNKRDGVYGGSSAWSEVSFEGQCDIVVHNLFPDQIVWCTDANGETFFRVGEHNIISEVVTADPLKTLMMGPPLGLTHLAHTLGRLLGAVGNRLHFSEEYRYDLFPFSNYFEFPERIRMVAPVNTVQGIGVYVGLETRTVFLSGASPFEMREFSVGAPVTEGTLAYCQNVPNLGNNIPAWVAKDGIVFGTPGGALQNTTIEKIRLLPGLRGASAFRVCDGSFQYVAAFKRSEKGCDVGFGDEATCEVVRNGKVI